MTAGFISNKGKWNRKEQSVFILKLGELLSAGYHLSEALTFLQSQEKGPRRQKVEQSLCQLKSGNSLHDVLLHLGFHPHLLQFVYYAEYYGDVPKALMEGGEFWRKRSQDREQLIKVLMYPMMLVMMVVIIGFMLQSMLLPKFQALYESMEMAPSLAMKVVQAVSSLSGVLPYVLSFILLVAVLFYQFWFKHWEPLQKKSLILRIPFIGAYIRLYDTYYLSFQLGALLSGGLSINDSIHLFAKHNQQPFFQHFCQYIYLELVSGQSLESVFKNHPYFEPYLPDVVENGQKNGKLDQELYHYSKLLMARIEQNMSRMIKLVQPVLFISVGLIVVAIYLSVLMPMFSMMDHL